MNCVLPECQMTAGCGHRGPKGEMCHFTYRIQLDELTELRAENDQLRAKLREAEEEVATYAGTNTNLRNDLVLMGMAKDAALAQVEEVKTRCSQVADAVKDDADQRAIGLKFEDLHEMRVRSDTAREIGETIRALELSSTERTAVCEICGKCEGRHHKEFDGFVCEECQSQWTERANG